MSADTNSLIALAGKALRMERERDAAYQIVAALAAVAGGELRVPQSAVAATPEGVRFEVHHDTVLGEVVIRVAAPASTGGAG